MSVAPAAALAHVALSMTPSPSPPPAFDANQVTPGIVGFLVTFGIMVAAVLLVLDMVRRIRRTNYRAQIREQLDAEERDAELEDEFGASDGQPTDAADEPGEDEPGTGSTGPR